MKLQELLALRMPELANCKVKLVRHADGRSNFQEIKRNKEILFKYQSEQSRPVFHDCDYIISFLGLQNSQALLLGIFKVNGAQEVTEKINESDDWNYVYDLELLSTNNIDREFYDRIVIDWGKSTTAWHQWYNQEKEVIELLPEGYIGEFPGHLELILDFFELEILAQNHAANKTWINKLASVNGIYLILDKKTGNQYIGSAYGNEGIWGRWKNYINTKHGGNKGLIELMEKDPLYYQNFTFSILQTLPINFNNEQVIRYENLYKQKLGTRAFGLNHN